MEIGIKKDHIHLYMVIPPKYAVSKVVETIKSNISKALKIKFAFLKKVYWDDKGIWAKGYFVSTVGINEKIIKEYVRKKIRTKYCNLIKLGLPDWKALSLANTRKAYWHIASDSLNSALLNAYWANLGLISLTNCYCEIRSAL